MKHDNEYEIEIYHKGVHFKAPARGSERYLLEKRFLDDLTNRHYAESELPRPIPDPTQDFYELTDDQLEAYSAFRRKQGT